MRGHPVARLLLMREQDQFRRRLRILEQTIGAFCGVPPPTRLIDGGLRLSRQGLTHGQKPDIQPLITQLDPSKSSRLQLVSI